MLHRAPHIPNCAFTETCHFPCPGLFSLCIPQLGPPEAFLQWQLSQSEIIFKVAKLTSAGCCSAVFSSKIRAWYSLPHRAMVMLQQDHTCESVTWYVQDHACESHMMCTESYMGAFHIIHMESCMWEYYMISTVPLLPSIMVENRKDTIFWWAEILLTEERNKSGVFRYNNLVTWVTYTL